MTNEEAIKKIKSLCHDCDEFPHCVNTDPDCFKALEMAIKVLSAEPCEDCISRTEAIKAIRNYNVTIEVGRAIGKSQLADIVDSINKVQEKMISELPSIQPKPKTGHWIKMGEGFSPYQCSECETVEFKDSKYCPNCGAKMESEDKE